MGKYRDFPSHTPQKRSKSAIYSPKQDDKHPPRHFYMGVLLGEKREPHHNPLPVKKFTIKKITQSCEFTMYVPYKRRL